MKLFLPEALLGKCLRKANPDVFHFHKDAYCSLESKHGPLYSPLFEIMKNIQLNKAFT